MTRNPRLYLLGLTVSVLASLAAGAGQSPGAQEFRDRTAASRARMEKTGLAEPFRGVTTNGTVVPNLFEIRSTGVSTAPVREAAGRFLATLAADRRQKIVFPVDHIEWRRWANQHSYQRDGVSFEEMSGVEREAGYALLAASLSAKGLTLTRDIMRLNETLGELNGGNFIEYGEHKYWLSLLGEPSPREPWGWQLDGHHLIINYFVLGDQVVMTPAFWGSEPTVARSGKFAGTAILVEEQAAALAMMRALTPAQRQSAILMPGKTGNSILAQAFSDNLVLDYAGVRVSSFTAAQKQQLLALAGLYVNNLRDGHARVHLADVERHLDDTYFAWIGDTGEGAVFYYRIHSPVVLIEFDHQTPVGLRQFNPAGVPNREHIHAVVRTPNGNDYGKDLLRLHYAQHPH
jgi:hypothetical protein